MIRSARGLAAASLTALCLLGGASSVGAADAKKADGAVPKYVTDALAAPGRPMQEMMDFDAARKLAGLIAFAGIKPGDQVADLVPGDGNASMIFSKLVGAKGHVYPIVTLSGTRNARQRRDLDTKLKAHDPIDDVLWIEDVHEFRDNLTVIWENIGQYGGQFEVPVQLDAVWTQDAYHEFHYKDADTKDMVASNKAIFLSLKPGGTYTVIDYAAAPGAGFTQAEALKRSEKDAVKAEIVAAGFVFDGESDMLSVPSDDMKSAAVKDKASQFVLRFKKPMTAPNGARPAKDIRTAWYGNTSVDDTPDKKYRISIFLHADGSYQEYQNRSDRLFASGWHYIGADGKLCILHESPAYQRGYSFCTAKLINEIKPGVNFYKGYVWPPDNSIEPEYP